MAGAGLLDRRTSASDLHREPDVSGSEAAEVARLLMRAGVDRSSALWFQLLELATQQACDWTERAAGCRPPLGARAAAVLGLRSLAAALLSSAPEQDEHARAAAEACLAVCAEAQPAPVQHARPRRWGEGAVSPPPQRASLLNRAVGRC